MNRPVEIRKLIYVIRNQKVMFDSDLAKLYEIETKRLNEAVKRNIKRFPEDFMFRLTKEEFDALRSQFATSAKTGGRQYLPYVFTEQGVAMLSSILHTDKAINANIQIMRTFVQLRQWAIENKELAQRLSDLEKYFIQHCEENEADVKQLYETLNLLMDRTKPSTIGFKTKDD